MAAIVTSNLSSLKLRLNKGLDAENNEIIATKTYGYVDSEATDQNVLDVANIIIGLQKHDLEEVIRINSSSISE